MLMLKFGQMRRVTGAVLIGTLTLSGCVRWQAHTAPEQALRGAQRDVVIVHPLQGPGIYVFDPRITADSVQGVERIVVRPFDGVSAEDRARGYRVKPVSIALSAIRAVETPTTTFTPFLVGAVLAMVVFAIMVGTADW